MSHTNQNAIDWLIEQVKSKLWQDMYIWQKEEVFRQAKVMANQTQLPNPNPKP